MASIDLDERTIRLTNQDRVLFPADGITKGDLVEYHRRIAERMLPHLVGRPLVMERFPDGIDRGGFMQKDVPRHFPEWIERAALPKRGGQVTHVVCSDAATLVYLANQGMVTAHVWTSRADRPEHPDQLVFDLDPGDDPTAVPRAAAWLKDLLDELELPAFAKSSGSRGIHVHVPLDGTATYGTVGAFALDLAGVLAGEHPGELTTAHRKAERAGRLYLDTLRNGYAQHAVATYGVRARAGAPVAVPLDWKEATGSRFDARRFTVRNVFRRLANKEDPWRHLPDRAVSLERARELLRERRGDA